MGSMPWKEECRQTLEDHYSGDPITVERRGKITEGRFAGTGASPLTPASSNR